MIIKLENFSPNAIYHIMTQTVIPRPIAWVLTDSGKKNYNLAPFSYFTAVSSTPPLLMISVGKKPDGTPKDTIQNIQKSKQMVIHITTEEHANAVTQTAATLPYGESEVTANNIALAEFDDFDLPRVADCSIAFACSLFEKIEMGNTPQTLVFCEIKSIYVADHVAQQDCKGRLNINADLISPLARLGGGEYASLSSPFTIKRPV